MNFFSELIKRWQSESPKFFVTIQNLSISLIAIAGLIIGIPAAVNEATGTTINLGFLNEVAKYILVAATIMGAVAKTAVKNPAAIV